MKRLTSRKFIGAVGAFVTFVVTGNIPAAVAVALAYIAAEYHLDLTSVKKGADIAATVAETVSQASVDAQAQLPAPLPLEAE